MPRYTTGEIAKLCGVSVRTVQYYDTRRLLVPSELSEGGRRLYSEEDLRRMRIICFLREAGLPINSISDLLSSDHPGNVISILVEQQRNLIAGEISQRQAQLELLEEIRRDLKDVDRFSIDSIGDIAYRMENKKKMRRLHMILLITGIPLNLLQWITLVPWITAGIWQPFVCYVLIAIPYAIWVSNYYFSRVEYLCPQCHQSFRPPLKEAFWANHTPTLRKLTCTHCGYRGFCVETYGKEKEEND